MNDNTTYITLTQEELQDLIAIAVQKAQMPKWVRGIPGLMQIFSCSESTAKRIKKSGTIKKAIRQQGRTFITNVELASSLYGTDGKHHL